MMSWKRRSRSRLPAGRPRPKRMAPPFKLRKISSRRPRSRAPQSELREVLTNLIFNSVDAMPHGGANLFPHAPDGAARAAEVGDTGAGMTDETIRHCLEPFYTTKGEGGSGLGLAMSYGIIKRHGGTISIDSRLREGTIFTIYLPLPDQPIEAVLLPDLKREVCPLRVLVVDDHPGIREIVTAYLAEDRHRVETAADAQEAMDKFRGDRFDLVIIDQAMPEMNGNGLAAMIKRASPTSR